MKKKTSKYAEMVEKMKAEKAKPKEVVVEPAVAPEEIDKLLAEALNVFAEVEAPVVEPAAPESPYHSKEQEDANKKLLEEVIHPEAMYAYNIWYSKEKRTYVLDTIKYEGDKILSVKSEKLTTSQALALAKIKEIFSRKLILKQKGL